MRLMHEREEGAVSNSNAIWDFVDKLLRCYRKGVISSVPTRRCSLMALIEFVAMRKQSLKRKIMIAITRQPKTNEDSFLSETVSLFE